MALRHPARHAVDDLGLKEPSEPSNPFFENRKSQRSKSLGVRFRCFQHSAHGIIIRSVLVGETYDLCARIQAIFERNYFQVQPAEGYTNGLFK